MNVFSPAVAPGFLAFAAAFGVFVFVVEPKFTADRNICPALGIKDGAIALGMEFA